MDNRPRDLATRLADLLRRERVALADFLLARAEFDRERVGRELGYAGLFPFLHRELGLSRAAAFFRMKAAQLVRRFPEVIELLRDGRLCLTSVVELAKVLTPENREAVLPRFFHCSKQEAKAVSAELAPVQEPPRRAVVTALAPQMATVARATAIEKETSSQSVRPGEPIRLEVVTVTKAEECSRPRPPTRDETVPLTASLNRLHVTVSRAFLEKLEAARLALSHARPGASIEDVPRGRARSGAREGREEEGAGLEVSPASGERACSERVRSHPRRDPPRGLEARRWVLPVADRVGRHLRLAVRPELDHIVPRGRGGVSTVGNLRVLCRAHNDMAARLAYGDGFMERAIASSVASRLPNVAPSHAGT